MHPSHPGLIEQLAAWPTTRAALRLVPAWTDDPVLNRFANPAQACLAADSDLAVFAALAARTADQTATHAALALVASRLVWVTRRRRYGGGLYQDDQADTEASLATEALACMRDDPHRPPDAIARTVRHRVHNQRRTSLARAARHLPLPEESRLPAPYPVDTLRQPLTVITDAIAAGTLTVVAAATLWATVCGWATSDAARVVGCSTETWRTRRSRAARAVRATLGVEGDI